MLPQHKKKKVENSILQRLLLHLGVNIKTLNVWSTVNEEDDLLYFLLPTVLLNCKFLKMFLTFLYHTDVLPPLKIFAQQPLLL